MIGLVATFNAAAKADMHQREALQIRAETAAKAIEAGKILDLRGSENDLGAPSYEDLKIKMVAIREIRPDTRFVYLMGYDGADKLFFYVDSEDPESEDYSAPGDVYEETNAAELAAFKHGRSFVEGPLTDDWGTWVTAFAPINNADGETLALLGMDVESSLWYVSIREKEVAPFLMTLFLIMLIGVYLYISWRNDLYIAKMKKVDTMKTEFVSLASHQLNTPLSTINWITDLLLTDQDDPLTTGQKKYVEGVAVASGRMVNLVDALLNVSRIEMGTFAVTPVSVNLGEVVQSLLAELDHQIKDKKLSVEKEIDSSIPAIPADESLVRIIFQNLLTNAVKYNTPGGTLAVKIARNPAFPHMIYSEVRDTGLGVPKKDQARIFQKLFRADNARTKIADGNGLGLYIVKAIIESVGGTIWFESEENKGTTFSFTLPLEGMKAREGAKALVGGKHVV